MNQKIEKLQEKINYQFQDSQLFRQALTHSSYANEHKWDKSQCNERLEFLGDAVLEIISSDFLYHKYPKKSEGELTKIRASIVCEATLSFCAEAIQLGQYLFLGKGEESTGGRQRHSVVSDALEALIGAIYLDGGFANAKEFVVGYILNDIENKQLFYDSKTILQEIIQGMGEYSAVYELLNESGPDHNKTFEVCVRFQDQIIGSGTGRTKKAAEQVAAYHGILTIKNKQV